jgi:phosphoribosylformylglycinamidine synthase
MKGVVVSCGMAPQILDPYEMAVAAIDEAIRNAVAVGADLSKLAILDNFCWPSVDDEKTMGTLVAACEACYDAAKAYGVPFISGKDSLHNQFTNQETGEVLKIPNTLLISAIGVIEDVRKCVTMDLKRVGSLVGIAKPRSGGLGDLAGGHRAMSRIISAGDVLSCHDVSDGGVLVAAAEMCIASGFGMEVDAEKVDDPFGETPGRYLIEMDAMAQGDVERVLGAAGVELKILGRVTAGAGALDIGRLTGGSRKVEGHLFLEEMRKAWRGTLDW